MKERPILFTPENAQKTFDEKKTQTRRVIKPQPISQGMMSFGEAWKWNEGKENWFAGVTADQISNPNYGLIKSLPCPFGVVGDRLWVREAWADYKESTPSDDAGAKKAWENFSSGKKGIVEAAKDIPKPSGGRRALHKGDFGGAEVDWKWRNAMFMPRWACRTILEITDVRVQRVQDISPQDARDEGVEPCGNCVHLGRLGNCACPTQFKNLWDSINAKKHPWKENPWVWAITFRKVLA